LPYLLNFSWRSYQNKAFLANPFPPLDSWDIETYLRQSHIRHNNGVERTGGVAERLALVAVRVILVFEDLAFVLALPGHSGFADADVAFGGYGGGLAAEEPVW
jgi:hypothetical protein